MKKDITYTQLKELLNEHGLKSTHQRLVIYKCLMDTDAHPTADEIYNSIKEGYPTISLATVYKTLESLATAGLANKVMSNDGYMRYDGNTELHNHIYITNTHEIVDYEDSELSELLQSYFDKKNISNLKISNVKVQINAEKINPKNKISIS